jgi:hypothetical protein
VLDRAANLGKTRKDFAHLSFDAWTTRKIGVDRRLDRGLVVADQVTQSLYTIAPFIPLRKRVGVISGALDLKDNVQLGWGIGSVHPSSLMLCAEHRVRHVLQWHQEQGIA